jgi:hypothetical protein
MRASLAMPRTSTRLFQEPLHGFWRTGASPARKGYGIRVWLSPTKGEIMTNRLDEMAKALAGELPRREALKRLGGLVVGGLAASLGLPSRAWADDSVADCFDACCRGNPGVHKCHEACKQGAQTSCGGVCCPSSLCISGTCCPAALVCGTGSSAVCCAPPSLCIAGKCCPATEVCPDGPSPVCCSPPSVCVSNGCCPPGTPVCGFLGSNLATCCPSPGICCPSPIGGPPIFCVNPATDILNCGGCGHVCTCPVGETPVCTSGTCSCV